MSIEINLKLTADNPSDLQRQFAELGALLTQQQASPVSSTKGNGRQPEPEVDHEAAEAAESLGLDAAPRKKVMTKKVTEATLRKVLTTHMQKFSEEDTVELVKKHAGGVSKIRDIDPSYYGAVVEAAEAELS